MSYFAGDGNKAIEKDTYDVRNEWKRTENFRQVGNSKAFSL